MIVAPQLLLIGAVAAVGVLHTIVPDHWVPIALIARQRGWSKAETARAAVQAGAGHVLSTLLIASVVWLAGTAMATRFGHFVDLAASAALVIFGGWISFSALRELRGQTGHGHRHSHAHPHAEGHHHDHDSGHDHESEPADDPLYAPLRGTAVLMRHSHVHRHGHALAHVHKHDHTPHTAHVITDSIAAKPPLHEHLHKTSARTALLLIVGSSPMIEGIPAFFAASNYGIDLMIVMALVFAISTIVTYVVLCVYSTVGLERVHLGAFERYGEVLSGAFIALVGVVFWIWPVL
jgi:ABC-type nickel/cobalt efflux system permease component RcnA